MHKTSIFIFLFLFLQISAENKSDYIQVEFKNGDKIIFHGVFPTDSKKEEFEGVEVEWNNKKKKYERRVFRKFKMNTVHTMRKMGDNGKVDINFPIKIKRVESKSFFEVLKKLSNIKIIDNIPNDKSFEMFSKEIKFKELIQSYHYLDEKSERKIHIDLLKHNLKFLKEAQVIMDDKFTAYCEKVAATCEIKELILLCRLSSVYRLTLIESIKIKP